MRFYWSLDDTSSTRTYQDGLFRRSFFVCFYLIRRMYLPYPYLGHGYIKNRNSLIRGIKANFVVFYKCDRCHFYRL